jgi:hypothetical protein
MPQWLLDILIGFGGTAVVGIGSMLMAKFMVADKLTNLLDGLLFAGQKVTEVFVGKYAGVKNKEEADELLWGTIYLVLRNAGQKGIDRIKATDTDGDFKPSEIPIAPTTPAQPVPADTGAQSNNNFAG